jgi:SAM-dependent methyltransferase
MLSKAHLYEGFTVNILRSLWYSRLFDNTRFRLLRREFNNRPYKLLDVGAGHTVTVFSKRAPNCDYSGIEFFVKYGESERSRMNELWELDLTKLEFDEIPNDYFDAINMAHVIEHLENGDEVISKMLSKLKSGGVIYIEYPGEKSTRLPRWKKRNTTLNFYDDDTHVRIFDIPEVEGILKHHDFQIMSSGIRRSWMHILVLMPVGILSWIFLRKQLRGDYFWDALGFAEYVFARKS